MENNDIPVVGWKYHAQMAATFILTVLAVGGLIALVIKEGWAHLGW